MANTALLAPTTPACSAEVEWHSGGPGKSAYTDYRWQCACGQRYGGIVAGLSINSQHYAHLSEVAEAAFWEAHYAAEADTSQIAA